MAHQAVHLETSIGFQVVQAQDNAEVLVEEARRADDLVPDGRVNCLQQGLNLFNLGPSMPYSSRSSNAAANKKELPSLESKNC